MALPFGIAAGAIRIGEKLLGGIGRRKERRAEKKKETGREGTGTGRRSAQPFSRIKKHASRKLGQRFFKRLVVKAERKRG